MRYFILLLIMLASIAYLVTPVIEDYQAYTEAYNVTLEKRCQGLGE